jgi:hypothetical protein
MTATFIRPRLRKPLRDGLIGAVLVAAIAVPGGKVAFWAIVVAAATVGRVVALYVRSGEDSDEGALAGSRGDERVRVLGLRIQALEANVVKVAALAGLAAGVALRADWWWPFAVMLALTGFAYLFGLSFFASPGEDADDEAAGAPAAGRGSSFRL